MAFAEYESETFRSYEIFPSGRYEFVRSDLSVQTASRTVHPYNRRRVGKEIGLLIGVERLADKNIMTTWATGYGAHNTLVRIVTGEATRPESVLESQLTLDDGAINVVGSYYMTGHNPRLYIGGERLKNVRGTGRLEAAELDVTAKEFVRDTTLACGYELGRLAGERALYIDMQYCFATPTSGGFTEHGTLYLDL